MTDNKSDKVCPFSLKILGDFWTVMIISELANGPARFRDLENNIESANTATLSGRLKSMQEFGLITRSEKSRAEVTYELSKLGRQVLPVIDAINGFSDFAKLNPDLIPIHNK